MDVILAETILYIHAVQTQDTYTTRGEKSDKIAVMPDQEPQAMLARKAQNQGIMQVGTVPLALQWIKYSPSHSFATQLASSLLFPGC